MYDEVNETEYAALVRSRQAEEDFVVDDGTGDYGYVDDGGEVWNDDDQAFSGRSNAAKRGKCGGVVLEAVTLLQLCKRKRRAPSAGSVA